MKLIYFSFLLLVINNCWSQADFGKRKPVIKYLTKDFGAIANDGKDDSWALIKAAMYAQNKWDEKGNPLADGVININYKNNYFNLVIPFGEFNVGKQVDIHKGLIDNVNYSYKPSNKQTTPIELPIIKYSSTAIFGNQVPASNKNGVGLQMAMNCNSPYFQTIYKLNVPLFYIYNNNSDKNSIDGIAITGILKNGKRPIIKYNNNLFIGSIDGDGKAVNGCDTRWNLYSLTSNLFNFTNVNNTKIENIDVNGNNENVTYLGPVTDGFQGGHSGAYYVNCKNSSIINTSFVHMGTDGFMINDNLKLSNEPTNFFCNNVIANYNRRQGFSWVGGKNISVKNSQFNNNGRSLSRVQPKQLIFSQPCSGIDIECETGAGCFDGYFDNCEISNNKSFGVVNDAYTFEQAALTNNINFNNCNIYAYDTWGIWVRGEKITFNNSGIYAPVIHLGYGNKPGIETKFIKCNFEDKPTIVEGKKYNWNYLYNLVHSNDGSYRTYFDECKFTVNDSLREMFFINSYSTNIEDFTLFQNCTFIYNAKGSMKFGNTVDNTYLFKTLFIGNNNFTNTNKTKNNYHRIITTKFVVASSNKYPKSILSFNGNILHDNWEDNGIFEIGKKISYLENNKITIDNTGDVKYIINENATSSLARGNTYNLFKNASIVVNENGTLYLAPATILNNEGNIEFTSKSKITSTPGNFKFEKLQKN